MHKYKVGDTVIVPEFIGKTTKISKTLNVGTHPVYNLAITDTITFCEESITKMETVTNFEYYAEEIKALNAIDHTYALHNGEVVPCCGLSCDACEFYDKHIPCNIQKTKWLYEEAKPKKEISLSEKERKLLEILSEKYKYIARDKNKRLYAYLEEPYKANNPSWRTEHLGDCFNVSQFDDVFSELLFTFVEWEDDAAYKISDLLALPKVK